MEKHLDPIEARVLGCLIEKELATPDYYPLTLLALVNACNQKLNRDPVLDLSEAQVSSALATLADAQLAIQSGEGGRVRKHRHLLFETWGLGDEALAILCELLVRGPQTQGELRTRAGRMSPFADLAAVGEVLRALEQRDPPLVAWLPRQTGRREARVMHLLSGPPEEGADDAGLPPASPEPTPDDPDLPARIEALEAEVCALRAELEALRDALAPLLS